MLKNIISFFVICIVSPAIALCSGTNFTDRLNASDRAEIAAAVESTPYPSGIFWQATRGAKTLNIIGTMHLYDPRLDAVFDRVVGSIDQSELLLVEATPDDELRLQELFARNPDMVFITEGPTLIEQLDTDTWAALEAAANERMIPGFMAGKMQPWYLSLTLSIPPCLLPELAAGQTGLDGMLMDHAATKSVPIEAVEDPIQLIEALSSGSPDDQLEALRLSVVAPEIQLEMFVAMLDSYFAEDIAEIWEVSRISGRYVPGIDLENVDALFANIEEELLLKRNRAWIPVIETAMEGVTTATIAVGAGHLPGVEGVLSLLEAQGWQISALP